MPNGGERKIPPDCLQVPKTYAWVFEGIWVPEGSLAKNCRAGFPGLQPGDRPRDPPRSPGLARDINLHQKSTPETNSKAISSRVLYTDCVPAVERQDWVIESNGFFVFSP